MLTRRKILKAMGVGAAATAGGGSLQQLMAAESDYTALKIPALSSGTVSGDSRSFNLELRKGTSQFLPGLTTPTWGINGDYLGPTLRMRRNELISLAVNNRLGETSTIHWHGFHLPAEMDGGPHQPIATGDTWVSQFQMVQYAGTYWYHSHMLHTSGEQVYKGLAGMIIVDDDQTPDGIPSEYGVDDIPLVIQDRRFNEDGSFAYMDRYEDMVKGMHGDSLLVNGTHRPMFVPSTRLVRFRLLNGSNARTYTIALSDEREFRQIASDGGFLQQPLGTRQLELAPGERGEIVVEFTPGESVNLVSLGKQATFPEFPGGLSEIMRGLNAQAFDVLALRPAGQLQESADLPGQLNDIYRLPEAAATNTRSFRLSMGYGMRSGSDKGPGTGLRNGAGGGHGGGNSSINGRRMEEDYINERIELNTTEIWELSNNSPMMHPFHVHNGQFQILDRNGEPPPANEMGWKDTVKVDSGENVRIIMRFTDFTSEEYPYMYHCHILEHEDQGMMGQFLVV